MRGKSSGLSVVLDTCLIYISEHGSGAVRDGVRGPAVRRLQPPRAEGPGALGQVQDTLLHVFR